MTDVEILKAARARIEQGWCQRAYAQDAEGSYVSTLSPDADSYCLSGALWATAGLDDKAVARCLVLLSEDGRACGVIAWNDQPERTKEEVLARYDQAIAKAEALQ